jgi:WD40 repeat protein
VVGHALLEDDTLQVDTVILSGSVLELDFPWHELLSAKRVKRVVNECGSRDLPLLASHFLGSGTSMAGLLGFRGMIGAGLINRFYVGGHSLYFKRPGFMAASWVPLLTTDDGPVVEIDERPSGRSWLPEFLVQNATAVKIAAVLLMIGMAVWGALGYITSTRQAMARQLAAYADVAREQQSNPELGGLIAIESLRKAHTDEGERALRRSLLQLPVRMRRFTTFANPPTAAIGDRTRNLAVVTHGSDVDIYRMSDGLPMNVLRHPDDVDTLAVSADGRFVATSAGPWLYVWDASPHLGAHSARQIGRIESQFPGQQRCLDVSSDATRLLEAREGGDVNMYLYDVKTGKTVKHIESNDGGVNDTAFSIDGQLLAIAVENVMFPQAGGIQVWDGRTGEPKPAVGRKGNATSVAISADSSWIAAGYDSGTIQLWKVGGDGDIQLNAGSRIKALDFSPTMPNRDPARDAAVAEGTRGEWLASLSDDAVRLWDFAASRQRSVVANDGTIEAIAFSPEAERLATLRANSAWDMWTPVAPFSSAPRHSAPIVAAAISCNGKALLTAAEDGTLRTWDAATGRALRAETIISPMARVDDQIYHAAYVCEQQADWLAAVPRFVLPYQSAVLVALQSMGIVRSEPFGEMVSVMASSPNGQWIALGSESEREPDETQGGNGSVTVWAVTEDWHGGPRLQSTFHYGGTLKAVAVNSDGSTVAAAGDRGVRVWTSSHGKASIDVTQAASSVSTDDAGRLVVVGNDDRRARVVDVTTGRVIRTIPSDGPIRAVQLRRDGSVVAIAATGVNVFKTTTGELAGRIADARDVTLMLFTRDGRSLMTVAGDTVQMWQWDPDDLMKEGCARIGRNLTEAEWRRYFGARRYAKTCPDVPSSLVRR